MRKKALDTAKKVDYHCAMKKSTKLKATIREHRKMLRGAGFKQSALSMWMHGNRTPSYSMALKLAEVLGVDVEELPYTRTIIND